MPAAILEPRLSLLSQDYVLIQAWKKTASYIRYHNWFSDTLELDRTTTNLRTFIGDLASRLAAPEGWVNDSLRMVPAPKRQLWRVSQSGRWEPIELGDKAAPLRPLAHLSLSDQVAATAVMLCLANRVETAQRDAQQTVQDVAPTMRVISYGNRLYCDVEGDQLLHRWGSSKLYRSFYQDYRAFLARSESIGHQVDVQGDEQVMVVHSDIRQFYDRVRPELLERSLLTLRTEHDDPAFFSFASRLLNWTWAPSELPEVALYTRQSGLDDFSWVSLPQGLVSAGFFSNVVLLAFDERVRSALGTEIAPGMRLEDACRYVDDIRLVIAARHLPRDEVRDRALQWLQYNLSVVAPGLEISEEKTEAAQLADRERPLIRQSAKMERIQTAISGGFDALGGEEILDSIQGLVRSQRAIAGQHEASEWTLSPLPDVRDDTVARFAAARYRTTFRSLRPLLDNSEDLSRDSLRSNTSISPRLRHARTQKELDEEARTFALTLIERWVEDPSNVKLLLVALDLWPDESILAPVLGLLRPYAGDSEHGRAPKAVAMYCLAEIIRAAATETGFVDDGESLPQAVDVMMYREMVFQEATRLIALPADSTPWYVRQQALLFVAVHNPTTVPSSDQARTPETKLHEEMIDFLQNGGAALDASLFATLAVLARRAFLDKEAASALVLRFLDATRLNELAGKDPSFALELIDSRKTLVSQLSQRHKEDLSADEDPPRSQLRRLADIVLRDGPEGPLRNELTLLSFSLAFLTRLQDVRTEVEVITPGQVRFRVTRRDGIDSIDELEIEESPTSPTGSLYQPPRWSTKEEWWRFQTGFLLRFALSRCPDFTRVVRPLQRRERDPAYRVPESPWYLRLHGFYNGQPAFGDDWLPITVWMEHFLSALLHWPGARIPSGFEWVRAGPATALDHIKRRISALENGRGASTRSLFLPMLALRPTPDIASRSLRACVVQTAVPGTADYTAADLALTSPDIRRKHRNHLSAALAAVEKMLALRETSGGGHGRLDWLILPELAVHPRDVATHLAPFARTHKTIILAGLSYEELNSGGPFINSALWVIPEWTADHGLQLRTRRQGKFHLARSEMAFNEHNPLVRGFRPCQWLIGFPWSPDPADRPLWMTASVCYDATDLRLAADLRERSDVLAIPAFNKDVATFDQMALALHYHLFQLVIVANNGQYGGSNAYWPRAERHQRQIFHMHGQQTSIAFFDISDIRGFLRRDTPDSAASGWKHPPAGLGGTSD